MDVDVVVVINFIKRLVVGEILPEMKKKNKKRNSIIQCNFFCRIVRCH